MHPRLKFALKWIVGLAILAFLVIKLDVGKILATIGGTPLPVIALVLVYVFLTWLLNALNYLVLLRGVAEGLSYRRVLWAYMISWSLGKFTVGRVGEFAVIPLLREERVPAADGAAIILVDKTISFFCLLLIGAFGFLLFGRPGLALLSVAALVVLTLFGLFAVRSEALWLRLRRVIPAFVRSRAERLRAAMNRILRENRMGVAADLVLTFARLVFGGAAASALFLFYGVSVPIHVTTVANAIGTTIALLPVSISGLGIKESAMVILLGGLGVDPVVTGVVYMLIRVVGLVWGVAVLILAGRRLARL